MQHVKYLILATMVAAQLFVAQAFSQEEKKTAEDGNTQPEEKQYFRVPNPTIIDQNPDEYNGKNIQLVDRFAGEVSAEDYTDLLRASDRRTLQNQGYSPRTYYIFRTNAVNGGNLLCFLSRQNEDLKALAEAPLLPNAQIYLMGTVANRIFTDKGIMTLFQVDRIGAGTTLPQTKTTTTEKKPIFFTIEYEVETAQGKVRRKMPFKFKIPEPGKAYEIPDPYDETRKLYMTFEF